MKEYEKLLELTEYNNAYLINTNDLDKSLDFCVPIIKKILCNGVYKENCNECNICNLVDSRTYDDFYIVNPSSISILRQDLDNLIKEMQKSSQVGKNRVYVIMGVERISNSISNLLLKFIEDGNTNVYGFLLTKDINKVSNTIISRCQRLDFIHKDLENSDSDLDIAIDLIDGIIKNKEKELTGNHEKLFESKLSVKKYFNIIEEVLVEELKRRYKNETKYFKEIDKEIIERIILITDKLSKLIENNINLNLLEYRYIIEVASEVAK